MLASRSWQPAPSNRVMAVARAQGASRDQSAEPALRLFKRWLGSNDRVEPFGKPRHESAHWSRLDVNSMRGCRQRRTHRMCSQDVLTGHTHRTCASDMRIGGLAGNSHGLSLARRAEIAGCHQDDCGCSLLPCSRDSGGGIKPFALAAAHPPSTAGLTWNHWLELAAVNGAG